MAPMTRTNSWRIFSSIDIPRIWNTVSSAFESIDWSSNFNHNLISLYWHHVGDTPTPRSGHAVAAYGKYMFLYGGINFAEEVAYNDLYILDTGIHIHTDRHSSLWLTNVNTHMYLHTYIAIFMHVHLHTDIYILTHAHTQTQTHTHTHTQTHTK